MLAYCLLLWHLVNLVNSAPLVKSEVHHTTNAAADASLDKVNKRFGFLPSSFLGPAFTSTAAAVPSSTVLSPGEVVTGTCKAYAILSARGTSEAQVNPAASRGLISTVLATVPSGESYEVVYPATFNFLTDPEIGAADVMKHLDAMMAKCPTQELIFFGYSQGAMVMINAMNAGSVRARAGNVRGTIFYGNPYYRAGMPQNRGTATTGTGIGLLKNVVERGNAVPSEFQPVVRDFCNIGDPVCQGLFNLRMADIQFNIDGPAFPQHHYEGKQQEVEAIQFVIQQLQAQ